MRFRALCHAFALLTLMVAQVTGLRAAEFVHSFGDVHLYNNHVSQAELQLTRTAPGSLSWRSARASWWNRSTSFGVSASRRLR